MTPGRILVAGALLGLLPMATARAQITIRGTVIDPTGSRPAGGVRVDLGPGLTAWTDEGGRFELSAAPGRYTARLRCPRRDAAPLEGQGPTFEAGESARLDLEMPGGASCLPALSATEYGEFEGIYLARPAGGGWFRLCGDSTHRIAATFSAAAWGTVNRLARERSDSTGLAPRLSVRGALSGPGAFGAGGEADYQLGIEVVTDARLVRGGRCG